MINLLSLLDQYLVEVVRTVGEATELTIKSQNGRGLEVVLYGSFDRAPLDRCTITGFRIEGLVDDVPDEGIDENLYLEMTKAVLEGRYSYELCKKKWLDKLRGGIIYLTIGSQGRPLIKNFYCADQRRLKRLYAQGQLNPVAFIKKT